jgi:hypothetical protein
MREIFAKEKKNSDYPKFDRWEKLKNFIQNTNIKVTEIPILTDNYNLMDYISRNIFNMDISQRGIQRVVYNEIKSLDPLKIDLNGYLKGRAGSSKENPTDTIVKTDKKIVLYDENKLASRFKDEEIRCIIKVVEDKVKELGDKYFVTTGKNIEYKKANNIIKLLIELKQKE